GDQVSWNALLSSGGIVIEPGKTLPDDTPPGNPPSATVRVVQSDASLICSTFALGRMLAEKDHVEPAVSEHSENTDYGLRREILSPMETLAQSVSTMAPTTTPAATIPLVCALAGNGTWLAYVLATVAVLLVALCISRYARHSS